MYKCRAVKRRAVDSKSEEKGKVVEEEPRICFDFWNILALGIFFYCPQCFDAMARPIADNRCQMDDSRMHFYWHDVGREIQDRYREEKFQVSDAGRNDRTGDVFGF